ncbi:hypothetical protein GCM10010121_059230 [Streptomyces brasiliensis]|uniref:Uncharacterized protein n=2 Tax=Streptomyces brasiliensis TaxID=1954 RepID=A0A917L1E2_9ACTN|nr:hypothetical protein GCM10010121_059230 [Streptomyces brasiliensis]
MAGITAPTAVLALASGLLPATVGSVAWAARQDTAGSPPASTAAGGPVDWQVQGQDFRLVYRQGGRTVAAQAPGDTAGPGGRMAYQVDDGRGGTAYHRLTTLRASHPVKGGTQYTVDTDESGRTATVTVTRTPEGAHVAWTFTPSTGVTTVFETLSAGSTEHYLGGSSAAYVDLRGHIRGWSPGKEGNEAGDYCQNQEQAASTFYLSSGGYGFHADTDHIGRFAFPGATETADGPNCGRTPSVPNGAPAPTRCPVAATAQDDRVQTCVKDDQLAYDIYAGSPQQVTTAYYRTVGKPLLPPPSEFGVIKWRDVSADQAQVLDDVAEFKKLGIPIGTIFVDNPWEQQPAGNTHRINGSACTNSGSFDTNFFPDPKAMIDKIHAEGVKFGLWVTPRVGSPSSSQGGGSCAGINDQWAKNGWLIPGTNYIDLTIPAAYQAYVAQLTKVFSLGVDMAKEDRGEEYRLETATLAAGPGSQEYLRFPALYQKAVTQALRNINGNDFETLVRAGVPGTAQNTHGMWGSDTTQTFTGLRTELRYGISESLTGHFAWGSDTGGIDPKAPANSTNSPTPALFTRWSQFSSVSPVFEVGGAGLNATPWLYPTETVDRFRDSAVLHTELYPYFYALAKQAAATGVPIMRAVGYEYPSDQQAWGQDQEFMVGPDLLAAPVTDDRAEADGAAGQDTPVHVYLPKGRWVDVFTGEVVDGGRTISRPTGLDDFPLYLKAGTAIGFNDRAPQLWQDGWGTDTLSKPGLAGWLYAPPPSGASAVRTSAIGTDGGRMTASSGAEGSSLQLTGAPARTQIVVLADHAPDRITVDGRTLPRAGSTGRLRGMETGWTFTSGPFGGIVLKLRPQQGHAQVNIPAAAG